MEMDRSTTGTYGSIFGNAEDAEIAKVFLIVKLFHSSNKSQRWDLHLGK